jgi:protein involved in polysaccharide export with SLBB domain
MAVFLAGGQLVQAQTQVQTQNQAPDKAQTEAATPPQPGAPIRLRQPTPAPTNGRPQDLPARADPAASDFENYVNRTSTLGAGKNGEMDKTEPIKRFGSGLWSRTDGDSQDGSPLVPDDYVLQPGDEINISAWGSIDADLRLQIDRSGRINVPRVGAITLTGVRHGDLLATLTRRFDQAFKNYQLSASLAKLRGVRVYVTGFVNKPGAYTVSSLSSVANALVQAGGPSPSGGMREVQLRRNRMPVATVDLYDILLKGDRLSDRLVQPEDVIHVGPVGTEVAIVGSVNRAAIFELRPGETLADLMRMGGGFTAVADRSRLSIERLADRLSGQVSELRLPEQANARLEAGDVVRAFSAVDAVLPSQLRNKMVRVEGEVLKPGEYLLPAVSSVSDAVRAAGGLTPSAYLYGTEFNRRSVQAVQQSNYNRVLREIEVQLARSTNSQRTSSIEEATAVANNRLSAERLIATLRQIQPTGRVVFELTPQSDTLPDLALEDGDRLYIPPRQTTIGVFGSVFNAGSYLYRDGRLIGDYLGLAGGPTKGSDPGSIMVLRANGSVVAAPQRKGGWFTENKIATIVAEAGDTIFVPEELDKESLRTVLKDWTTIFYNFGLGAAAINAVFR